MSMMERIEAPAPPPGEPVRRGSEAHLRLFCRTLLDTHDPYRPALIRWPKLDEETRRRIVSLPVWDMAVAAEGRTGLYVRLFGETVADPLLKAAVEMDAFEESRHKLVLSDLVAAYDIAIEPEPEALPPRDAEWAFMRAGYSECIDSVFGFGLFRLAEDTGFFPPELVDTFEPVMREEARHILFFVNWAAWYRKNLPWWRRPAFFFKTLAVWAFLIWERIGIARGIDAGGEAQDANFTMTGSGAVGIELKPRELMELCLAENDRRMAGYDPRLLRPMAVPRMARLARKLLPKG